MPIILMFFIYSFIGWIIEVSYYFFKEKRFVNRGFLNGPIVPIYGLSMVFMHLFIHDVLAYDITLSILSLIFVFLLITTFATLLELIGGYILLTLFETRWWDYSHLKFNINGFVCLRFSLIWGVIGTLGYIGLHEQLIYPSLRNFDSVFAVILTNTFVIVFFIDWMFTIIALMNFKKLLQEMRSRVFILRNKSDSLLKQNYPKTSQSLRARLNGIIENTKNNETLTKIKGRIDSLREFFQQPKDKETLKDFEMLKRLNQKIINSRFYKAFPEIKLMLRKDDLDEKSKEDEKEE